MCYNKGSMQKCWVRSGNLRYTVQPQNQVERGMGQGQLEVDSSTVGVSDGDWEVWIGQVDGLR